MKIWLILYFLGKKKSSFSSLNSILHAMLRPPTCPTPFIPPHLTFVERGVSPSNRVIMHWIFIGLLPVISVSSIWTYNGVSRKLEKKIMIDLRWDKTKLQWWSELVKHHVKLYVVCIPKVSIDHVVQTLEVDL